jgi:hypothetical protein
MSFSATTEQIRKRTKTVTRRLGWESLKPGDLVQAVEKAQGLKKGEKVVKLAVLRIVSNRREQLDRLLEVWYAEGRLEVEREGFPGVSVQGFIEMFCKLNRCLACRMVNRIEFEYKEE